MRDVFAHRPEHGRRQTGFSVGVLLLGLLLAGCNTPGPTVGTSSSERTVPATEAYVLPPPGGPAIIAVTERSFSNGTEQQIALATASSIPGQNRFRVRLFGAVKGRAAGQTALPDQFTPLRTIDGDIRTAIPGVPLQRSPYYVQNRYGPFGYAVGRRGSDLCLYAWQRIRPNDLTFSSRGSIDVRLRACESGGTEAGLLAIMYGYTVNVFVDASGWNPYGEPAGVPEGLGRPGPDIYPESGGALQTVLPRPAPQPAPAARPRMLRAAAPQPAPQPVAAPPSLPVSAPPIGPAVPLPPAAAASPMPAVPAPPAAR